MNITFNAYNLIITLIRTKRCSKRYTVESISGRDICLLKSEVGGKRGRVFRNMYNGHMDNTKRG